MTAHKPERLDAGAPDFIQAEALLGRLNDLGPGNIDAQIDVLTTFLRAALPSVGDGEREIAARAMFAIAPNLHGNWDWLSEESKQVWLSFADAALSLRAGGDEDRSLRDLAIESYRQHGWEFRYEPETKFIGAYHPEGGAQSIAQITVPGDAVKDEFGKFIVKALSKREARSPEKKWKRGDRAVRDGMLCEFIEEELEGEKWAILGPAHPNTEGGER
jgi:hypothetical protein